ncbi:acetate/propionate family kinase [Arenibaculum pallidiluteum]|uniref:acetate/propionate family kinase n=1 Tax=Arenibaculum pallidiluteum TaxID=2812559 RepID=UPI001A96896C|nr:acetate/propionate family kinase [Arenibaculum pallidiluteum]
MADVIIVLNSGSSSIKFEVFRQSAAELDAVLRGQISGIGTHASFTAKDHHGRTVEERSWDPPANPTEEELLGELIAWIESRLEGDRIAAAGHRVVHGGRRFADPVLVTPDVMAELEALVPLAPLHQPHNLSAIRALALAHPGLPQVACFDTAFHRGHSDAISRFALPRALHEDGIRRYGFHGLSYAYVSRELARLAPELASGKVVIAHLGSGASLCAVENGVSIDSTMGFTAIDGLPMGTRCGSLDPGVVLHLLEAKGMTPAAIRKLLYNQSGLLGVSGISNDMRDLLASDRPEARQAIDLFVHRIVREIGALANTMGGLDGIAFTAGIGERSPEIRAEVCRRLGWLGLEFCPESNFAGSSRISRPGSRLSAWVIPTDEERMIAMETLGILAPAATHKPVKELVQ